MGSIIGLGISLQDCQRYDRYLNNMSFHVGYRDNNTGLACVLVRSTQLDHGINKGEGELAKTGKQII
jgi:hypothetical protein